MKTAPHDTAASNDTPISECSITLRSFALPPTTPDAIAANARYVGALSRKLDRPPAIQKYCHGSVKFSDGARALRISSAGIIVTKIPRNKEATSWIGWKWKWLAAWIDRG